MCDVIIETIDDWKLREYVKALSFDTTASNTIEEKECVYF